MINFSAYLYLKKGPFHFGTRAQLLLLGLSWCVLGYNEDGIQRRAVGDTVRPAGSCAGPLSDTDQDTNAEWLHACKIKKVSSKLFILTVAVALKEIYSYCGHSCQYWLS